MEHLSRVPKNRIAVLIGKSGKTREMIEAACGGSLTIDSQSGDCLLYTSPSPRDKRQSRMPSSA